MYLSLIRGDAVNPFALNEELRYARTRRVSNPQVARAREKIIGDASAIAVTGIRFIGRELNIIDRPIGLHFAELLAGNELDIDAKAALHLDVRSQTLSFIRMHNANKASLLEERALSDHLLPLFDHPPAEQREFDLGRKAVVHADQSRRTATTAAGDVIFVENQHSACLALRKLKCDGGAHHTGAHNHDIGRACAIGTHAAASLKRPFFKSRSTWCAALCPGAPVTPPPG